MKNMTILRDKELFPKDKTIVGMKYMPLAIEIYKKVENHHGDPPNPPPPCRHSP